MNSEYWVLVYTQTHMTLDKLLNFRVQFPYQEKGFNSNIWQIFHIQRFGQDSYIQSFLFFSKSRLGIHCMWLPLWVG